MRPLSVVLATVVAALVLVAHAPLAHAAPVTYVEPVYGRVTDPFRPPSTPYGRGNRGLQYSTADGGHARAAAPGRVTFAGLVGGARHVVIQHDDGVRTSYSFLQTIETRVGQFVAQSAIIGTTGVTMHFGARIGDAYIDPAILLAGGPARVHLIPDGEFTEEGARDDRFALAAIVADFVGNISSSAFDWVKDSGHALAEASRAIADGTIDLAALAAGTADDAMRASALHMATLLDEIVNMGEAAGPYAALAAALADILQAYAEPCWPDDVPPPPMPNRENRIAVFVAGLGSRSRGRNDDHNLSAAFGAVDALGYSPGNVYDYSYRGGSPGRYFPRDTTRDLRESARDLRVLLDRIARAHPGAVVDVIAHSQGGLITREALAEKYDEPGHRLPPIAHVVTLGTPHHGADIATFNAWMRWSVTGRALRKYARRNHHAFDLGGPGVAQLAETSDFIRELNDRPLRDGISWTSIAGAQDSIAPAVRARLKGARNVLVDSGNVFTSHSGLHETEPARRELQLALADAPQSCQSLFDTASRAFASAGIANFESAVSSVVAGAAR